MELRQLRYFVAVADAGNIGRAAAGLRIAQPSLSQQIRALERSLRVELFVREATGVRLTDAGVTLAEAARKVLAKATAFERVVEEVRDGATGELRIGTAPFIPDDWLVRAVSRFRRQCPDVKVSTSSLHTPKLVERLVARQVDAGFTRLPADHPDIATVVIREEPAGLLLRVDDPLAAYAAVPARQLTGRELVTVPREWNPDLVVAFEAAVRRAGADPIVERESDSITTTMDLARGGLGIPVTQQRWFHGLDDLTWRPISDVDFMMRWAVAYHRRHLGPLGHKFIAAVRAVKADERGV